VGKQTLEDLRAAVAAGGVPWRPMVRDRRGCSARCVDAWHPTERIALHVDWDREPHRYPAQQTASLLKCDLVHLLLARQWQVRSPVDGYGETLRVVEGVLGDEATARRVAASLPLRSVLLVGI
jgi:hypothetical protein